ncbi:hypothetical protein ACJX0J_026303, partial [Zea mays]
NFGQDRLKKVLFLYTIFNCNAHIHVILSFKMFHYVVLNFLMPYFSRYAYGFAIHNIGSQDSYHIFGAEVTELWRVYEGRRCGQCGGWHSGPIGRARNVIQLSPITHTCHCQVMCFIISINNLWLNQICDVRKIEGRRIVELWLMAHIMEKILNFMTLADIGQWFYFGVIGLIRKHQPCIYQISHLWNVDEISSDEISKGVELDVLVGENSFTMKHFCNMLLCISWLHNLQP